MNDIFRFAFRAVRRNKGFTLLNITGLAIGVATCLLIILYVQDEFSYDRFHLSSKDIVRVTYNFFDRQKGVLYENASAPNIIPSWLKENFPVVKQTARLFRPYPPTVVISEGNRVFEENQFFYADSGFFRVFDGYEARYGDLHTALSEPETIVLSASMAQKYFGDENPVGKYLRYNNRSEFRVSAVLQEPSGKSHLMFDFLASDLGIGAANNLRWDSPNYFVYALLQPETQAESFRAAINKEIGNENVSLGIQRLEDIHLRSQLIGEAAPNSDIRYLYIFSVIAMLVLAIACINYVNLATARAPERAREVGMLKVVGADQRQLFWKFVLEAVFGVVPALLLAQILVEISLPWFNSLTNKQIAMGDVSTTTLAGVLLGLLVLVSALAGVYPALVMSRYQPIQVLKGKFSSQARGVILRKTLVGLQFTVSMFLMIGAVIMYSQLSFLQQKNLGYDKEQLLTLRMDRQAFQTKLDVLRNEFMATPYVADVAASMLSPLAVPAPNPCNM